MTDPIGDPTQQEDVVHVGEPTPPRIGQKPSRKQAQAEAFARQRERESNDLRLVLGTEHGQALLMRILDRCGVYFDGHLTDVQQGKRLVGIGIIKDICALGPDAYPTMLTEHAKRAQRIRDEDAAAASVHASHASHA